MLRSIVIVGRLDISWCQVFLLLDCCSFTHFIIVTEYNFRLVCLFITDVYSYIYRQHIFNEQVRSRVLFVVVNLGIRLSVSFMYQSRTKINRAIRFISVYITV